MQVPWNVLEQLSIITMDQRHGKPLIQLTEEFLSFMFPFTAPSSTVYQSLRDIKHIVDLIRKLFVSSINGEEEGIYIE